MSDVSQPADLPLPENAITAAKAYDHDHRDDGNPFPLGWTVVSDRQAERLLTSTGAAPVLRAQGAATEREHWHRELGKILANNVIWPPVLADAFYDLYDTLGRAVGDGEPPLQPHPTITEGTP